MSERRELPKLRLREKEIEAEVEKTVRFGCMFSIVGFLVLLALMFRGPFRDWENAPKSIIFVVVVGVLFWMPLRMGRKRSAALRAERDKARGSS